MLLHMNPRLSAGWWKRFGDCRAIFSYRSDSRIVARGKRTTVCIQHGALLLLRQGCREHHHRNFQSAAPLQKPDDNLAHVNIVAVNFINQKNFVRKPQQPQNTIFHLCGGKHCLIHCPYGIRCQQSTLEWGQPVPNFLFFFMRCQILGNPLVY